MSICMSAGDDAATRDNIRLSFAHTAVAGTPESQKPHAFQAAWRRLEAGLDVFAELPDTVA